MTPRERPSRQGGWFHEKDGDFNPGWVVVVLACTVGILGVAIIFGRLLFAAGVVDSVLVGMAFAFLCFVIVALLTGVYSLGRAKLLNESEVLQRLSETFDVDERDEEQRARGD